MDWLQVGAFFVAALGLGLAGMVYVTRQFNRMGDRMTRLEERIKQSESVYAIYLDAILEPERYHATY